MSATAASSPLAPVAPPPLLTAADKLPLDKLKVAQGLKIEVYAAGVPNARTLRLGDKGTVFVSSRLQDKVHALVTKDGKPFAWINSEGVDVHRKGSQLYDSTVGGGSFFRPDGTLRLALDAALSSPTGLGVAVDDEGQLIGGVRADDVIKLLEEQRRVPEVG